jgi:hypothetical protein
LLDCGLRSDGGLCPYQRHVSGTNRVGSAQVLLFLLSVQRHACHVCQLRLAYVSHNTHWCTCSPAQKLTCARRWLAGRSYSSCKLDGADRQGLELSSQSCFCWRRCVGCSQGISTSRPVPHRGDHLLLVHREHLYLQPGNSAKAAAGWRRDCGRWAGALPSRRGRRPVPEPQTHTEVQHHRKHHLQQYCRMGRWAPNPLTMLINACQVTLLCRERACGGRLMLPLYCACSRRQKPSSPMEGLPCSHLLYTHTIARRADCCVARRGHSQQQAASAPTRRPNRFAHSPLCRHARYMCDLGGS